MQYALIGGECLLKVVDDHFVPIRRDCYLPLGRDDRGNLTSVGMMQTLYENGKNMCFWSVAPTWRTTR